VSDTPPLHVARPPVGGASGEAPELARARRLAALLSQSTLDVLLVTDPVNLHYLTGFTGTNGLALLAAGGSSTQARGEVGVFLTDFRYDTHSAAQVPAAYERRIVPVNLLEAAAELLGTPARSGEGVPSADGASATGASALAPVAWLPAAGRLGFEDGVLTVRQHARLGELVRERWELVPCGPLVEELREVKEPGEVERIRAAAQLADEALREVLEGGIVGRTEREVALELELRMRRLGAHGPSFPSIVAAGAHAALPHAEPREHTIPPDTFVLIDWGAVYEGYCSDCTRTYATGERLPGEAREVYEVVRAAQLAGLHALRPGLNGKEVDAVARAAIEAAGHGEHFGHGLGHGVGLEVHEAPRLSRTAGEEPLRVGSVVTVEPGVYLPGRLGVRIEDLVAVGDDRCEVLSGLPKELTVVP
jgi:Xaa-Pro aminopeptidase